MVIVPVGVKQSGGVVILAIGAEGLIGSGSISRTNAEEIHPELRSFAVTTYIVSGVNPVKLPEAWYAAPMLYSILGPEGVVISMVYYYHPIQYNRLCITFCKPEHLYAFFIRHRYYVFLLQGY